MKQIVSYWIFAVTSFVIISGWSNAHEIVELVVPAIADPRENAILSCRYNMGKDHLYSAKWFKDDYELFRYMPAQKPPGLPFPVLGIKLAGTPKCSQVACDLELMELQPSSGGIYRCEVSTEAPTFRVIQRNSSMIIAALPLRDPLVEGATTAYSLGDDIRVNCTSDPSLPPAEVTWYINDNEASYPSVDGSSESAPDSRGLSTRSLSLKLRAERSLFVSKGSSAIVDGLLKLRCVTVMPAWLPGGPHRRQFTITAKLRLDTHLNEKLGLQGSTGATSHGRPGALLMVATLMFLKSAFQQRPRIHY